MNRGNRVTLLIAAALFLLNVALNAALFLPGEGKYRDSIEAGYASMARFIADYPNPFGWNPYQYFGLPTHMWYLPAVPYSSALAIKLLPVLKPEHVYRLVVTTASCLTPVTVFLLAFHFTRNRRWAAAASIALTFFSPSYALFYAVNWDRGITYLPWRMQVLVKYGEGPHNMGLMLLPLALIALWRAATGRRRSDLVLAAVAMAAIALTNWVAALALAWCTLMLLVAGIPASAETGFLARRVLGASALAYLLACFWLTPEFIRVTAFNWPVDAFNYSMRRAQWVSLATLAAVVIGVRAAMLRFPKLHYLTFLALCLCGFFFIAAGHYWFGVDAIPEARRYAVEFEMFFFLFLAELCRLAWSSASPHRILLAGAILGAVLSLGAVQAWDYVTRGWMMLRPTPREQTVEFNFARFVDAQRPQGRIFATGGTRFRLNSWFLRPQVGGTFESGLVNRTAVHLFYQTRTGRGRPPEHWGSDALGLLRVAGAEYVIAHGRASAEHWKDLADPRLLAGFPKPVFESGDDRAYKLPYTGLANLVRPQELLKGLPTDEFAWMTREYVAAMDDTARPRLSAVWKSHEEIEITGPAPEGMQMTLRVSHDPGWRAEQDGQPLEVRHDLVNYILLQPRPARDTRIVLRYRGSTEQYVLTGVSALAWLALPVFLWEERRRRWKG